MYLQGAREPGYFGVNCTGKALYIEVLYPSNQIYKRCMVAPAELY